MWTFLFITDKFLQISSATTSQDSDISDFLTALIFTTSFYVYPVWKMTVTVPYHKIYKQQ